MTGGAGFSFENEVAAYFLASLLAGAGALGQPGIVSRVALQQAGSGEPLDDVIVDFSLDGEPRRLSLQAKSSVTISAAERNKDFRAIIANCCATRAKPEFRVGIDRYGFIVGHVTPATLRSLIRLIDWARSSVTGAEFEARFAAGGHAGAAERSLLAELQPLIGAPLVDLEADFYRHLVAEQLGGFGKDEPRRAEVANALAHLLQSRDSVEGTALFDLLCREANQGASTAKVWGQATLLRDVSHQVRLASIPGFATDLELLSRPTRNAIDEIGQTVGNTHVERELLLAKVDEQLTRHRLVNITGLPGCGKSAILRAFAERALSDGPALLLKSDKLLGTDWASFTTAAGMRHRFPEPLLAVIGAVGTPVLMIDGIDRIRPDQRSIVLELLRAIHTDPALDRWKVLVTSRDQGVEPFRTWLPQGLIASGGIGDIAVGSFNADEVERLSEQVPALRPLLFGTPAVREIARRPFFASVLERALAQQPERSAPGSEIDLITLWWEAGGHGETDLEKRRLRQRALIDLARSGACSLGKAIANDRLAADTIGRIADLERDGIVRTSDQSATFSFTHDIFFEWAFYRLFLGMGTDWADALQQAGEPPLLGRVIGLLSQNGIARAGSDWEARYAALENGTLRPQWRSAWLTAPPVSVDFAHTHGRFLAFVSANDFAHLYQLLVWFQAEHTVPSPVVLQNEAIADASTRIRVADALGWPSDFRAWGRMIDWLQGMADQLPAHLLPSVIDVFSVWQNAYCDHANRRSAAIISRCQAWLVEIESLEICDELQSGLRALERFEGRSSRRP